MSKITKRSYRRKKIIMGASLFGAIGLVSVGFAAWVLSAPAEQEKTGYLSVGLVSDKNMKFVGVDTYKQKTTVDNGVVVPVVGEYVQHDTFHFEPDPNDKTGRVRYDGTNAEVLSLFVRGDLQHVQNLGDITASIAVTADKTKFDQAISKGYIVAPEAYKATDNTPAVTLWSSDASTSALFEATTDGQDDATMTFSYQVKFTWGAAFSGMNPSKYFDETDAGKAVPQGSATQKTYVDSNQQTQFTVAGYLDDLHTLLDGIVLKLTLTANPN